MNSSDVRWIQRFHHFLQALTQLREAVELSRQRPLSKLEGQGLIKAFEFTHELAWNTLKDFLEDRGAAKLYGSRDATQEAFRLGLIENGDIWMEMIKSRNLTAHTYNQTTARQIIDAVTEIYLTEFESLQSSFVKLEQQQA